MIVSAVFWSNFPKERIIEQTFSVSENAETASLFFYNDFSLNFLMHTLENEFENKKEHKMFMTQKFYFHE